MKSWLFLFVIYASMSINKYWKIGFILKEVEMKYSFNKLGYENFLRNHWITLLYFNLLNKPKLFDI